MATNRDHWYLRVKTLNDEHLVDVGKGAAHARHTLAQAKEQMEDTGAITIANALVLNASDIVAISLHEGSEIEDVL